MYLAIYCFRFTFSQTSAKTWRVCTYTVLHRPTLWSSSRNRRGKVVLTHAMLKLWGRKCLSPVIKCQVYQSCYTQFCIAGLQDSSTEAPTMLHKTLGGPLGELTALTQIPTWWVYRGLLPTPQQLHPSSALQLVFQLALPPHWPQCWFRSEFPTPNVASSSSPYGTLTGLYVTYKNTYMLAYMCIATYRPMPT